MADGMRPVPTVRHTARRPACGRRKAVAGAREVHVRSMRELCRVDARVPHAGSGPARAGLVRLIADPQGLTSMSIPFLLISKRLVSCGGGTAPDVGGRRKSRRLYAAR